MKILSNRFIIVGVSVSLSLFFQMMVVASGERENGIKLRPLPSDRYLPQPSPSAKGYIWPAQGNLTSGFGKRFNRPHNGIDIAAPIGTPIIAAASGVVVFAGWSNKGLGHQVTLRHPDGNLTVYGHNQRLLVTSGQNVERGQQIAEMGSTGYSTGPHLHFELHRQGRKAVNPIAFLPGQKPSLTPEQAELIRRRR